MTTEELPGNTLGEKHRRYNQLVKEALESDRKLEELNAADLDVNNLIKIDLATKKRDVGYILKVLQCEDMLYVSRAIRQSTWLIIERQYSHVINPQYLHTNLFPQMMTKARAKLLLHIRLKLRDEDRVDAFYNYMIKYDENAALKWLPRCSLSLTEKAVKKNHVVLNYSVNRKLFKRLCDKSTTLLEICIKDCDYPGHSLQYTTFLIKENANTYLDFVETYAVHQVPSFGPRVTSTLMNSVPQRILDKFDIYSRKVHLPTIAKYLKTEQIQDLIIKMSQNKDAEFWFKYENLKHFVRYLPIEGRFDFLKKIFIQEYNDQNMQTEEQSSICSENIPLRSAANIYRWYHFAPFELAFSELVKLIRAESAPTERVAMLGIILSCAGRNMQHINSVLKYYSEKHINEPFKFKSQFVNMLLSKTYTYKFDINTWNYLNNIFHSMDVYIESEKNVQLCVEAIILRKVLHEENLPEIIKEKFKFQTMKSMQPKLKSEEKEKLYCFLLNFLLNKIKDKSIQKESELLDTVATLENFLLLISDWRKNLTNHDWFLDKIKELLKLKTINSWKADLSTLYRKFKICRKELFEHSLSLSPSKETYFNALKHNPELISHKHSAVEEMFSDDKTFMPRVLRTMRVYWPQSLASQWINWYLTRLHQPKGQKAFVRGFCTLSPQQQLISSVITYAPDNFNINWSEDDQHLLSLRKYLAQNMHLSRPLLPLQVILSYAKGDYLQFALPSLLALLYNMSPAQAREHISTVLDAPVSLQKHGIRSAFTKLEPQELKNIFDDIWKKPKHPSIRTVLFTQTYNLLCRQTNPTIIEEVWLLLSTFIDNLSNDENKIVYDILGKFDKVPMLVKGRFYMKSLMILKSLPPHKLKDCENDVRSL